MAGNRVAFEKAMQKGQEYAATNEWGKALAEYEKAAKEFPNDVSARGNLALALFQVSRWHDAIEQYRALSEIMPNNITILDHLAAACVNVGELAEAEDAYWDLAQLYVDSQRLGPAIETLERLVQLAPGRLEVHERLATLYEQKDDGQRAARYYLSLARLHAGAGRWVEATKYGERALMLDGKNADAVKLLEEVRAQRETQEQPSETRSSLDSAEKAAQRERQARLQRAAEELQSQGRYTEAVERYQEMLASGADEPQLRYSMGLLYQQAGQMEKAIGQFALITGDKEYAVSALYGLGECYESLRQYESAGGYYEKAIALIDVKNLRRTEMDELIQMYERAAESYVSLGDPGRGAAIYESLAVILHGRGWHNERTEQVRKRALDLTELSMRAKLRQLDDPGPSGMGARKVSPAGKKETGSLQLDLSGKKVTGPLRPITYFLPPIEVVEPHEGGATEPAVTTGGEALESGHAEEAVASPEPPPPGESAAEQIVIGPPDAEGGIVQGFPESDGADRKPGCPVDISDPFLAAVMADNDLHRPADGLDPDSPLGDMVATGDSFCRGGLFAAALDRYLEAVNQAPDYPPVHFRLADIYKSQAKLHEAVEKYSNLISLFELRGDADSLVKACQELLLLKPRDVDLREKLVRTLIGRESYALATSEAITLVEALLSAHRYEDAVEKARNIDSFLPQNPWAHLRYGHLLSRLAQYDDALRHFAQCLETGGPRPLALANLSINLILVGDKTDLWERHFEELMAEMAANGTEAETVFSRYEEATQQSRSPELPYSLGKLSSVLGRHEEAVRHFESSIDRLSPEDTRLEMAVRHALAKSFITLERPGDAIPHLLKCVSLVPQVVAEGGPENGVPSKVELLQMLADCYLWQGDLAEAAESIREAKELAPGTEGVLKCSASLHLAREDVESAAGDLQALLDVQAGQGDLQGALETAKRLQALHPDDVIPRERMIDVCRRLGAEEMAADALHDLARLQSSLGQIDAAIQNSYAAARSYWQMGKRERTFEALEQAVGFVPSPHNAPLRHELINLYLRTGQQGKAIAHLKEGAKTATGAGRIRRAVTYLQKILALSPNNVFAHYQLALILVKMGEYKQAAKLYTRLVRLQPANRQLAALRDQVLTMAGQREESPSNAV